MGGTDKLESLSYIWWYIMGFLKEIASFLVPDFYIDKTIYPYMISLSARISVSIRLFTPG